MDRLIVSPSQRDDEEGRKSRAFQTRLIGYISADSCWDLGRTADNWERPVWISYTGTEAECRAFTANLRTGRKVRRTEWVSEHRSNDREQIEIPRSSGFRWISRPGPNGTAVVTAYHPGLCRLEPLMPDDDSISFVCPVPVWWVDAQVERAREILGPESDARNAAVAGMATAFLDRRSPLPIIADLGFHVQLVAAALEESILLEHQRVVPKLRPDEIPGIERVIACCCSHERFRAFLEEQTAKHYAGSIKEIRYTAPVPGPVEIPKVLEMPNEAGQMRLF